jgi:hypothetical protein
MMTSSIHNHPCRLIPPVPSATRCLAPPATAHLGPSCHAPARLWRCNASSERLSYKDAGVDIDAGNELVRRIQKLNPTIGGFSGMVPFGKHCNACMRITSWLQ